MHPYITGLEAQPEVMEFVKEAADRGYNVIVVEDAVAWPALKWWSVT